MAEPKSAGPSGPFCLWGNWSLQYILANTLSLALFYIFSGPTFSSSSHSFDFLCALGLSGTTPRPLLSSLSPGHHITSTSRISFLGQLACTHCSTLGHLQ